MKSISFILAATFAFMVSAGIIAKYHSKYIERVNYYMSCQCSHVSFATILHSGQCSNQ